MIKVSHKQTNSFVFPDHNFGVILGARCASTSIKRAILESVDASDIETKKHKNPYILEHEVDLEELKGYKYKMPIFVTVRNPVDRILSVWRFLVKDCFWVPFQNHGISPEDSFDTFLDKTIQIEPQKTDIHLKPIWNYASWRNKALFNKAIKYENLQRDWRAIQQASKIPLPNLKTNNQSKHEPAQVTKEQEMKIKEYYCDDFVRFQYS